MEIVRMNRNDAGRLLALYRAVTADLRKAGVYQWDWFYPNRFVLKADLKRGTLFGIRGEDRIIGAVVVDRRQSGKYSGLDWSDKHGDPACIHRLAVHPGCQRQGIGKKLLQFAENEARGEGRTSIRLDVYTGNPGAVEMYRRAGYADVAAIRYPMRGTPFLCMEKQL
jgi:ribosomal protein S18 acetylase RimI-like enzyme